MNKRQRRLEVIERRWLARFGEPPTLRTDPELMEDILERACPAPKADRVGLAGPLGEESAI